MMTKNSPSPGLLASVSSSQFNGAKKRQALDENSRMQESEELCQHYLEQASEMELKMTYNYGKNKDQLIHLAKYVQRFQQNEYQYRSIIMLQRSRIERLEAFLDRKLSNEQPGFVEAFFEHERVAVQQEVTALKHLLDNQMYCTTLFSENVELKAKVERIEEPGQSIYEMLTGNFDVLKVIQNKLERNVEQRIRLTKVIEELDENSQESTQNKEKVQQQIKVIQEEHQQSTEKLLAEIAGSKDRLKESQSAINRLTESNGELAREVEELKSMLELKQAQLDDRIAEIKRVVETANCQTDERISTMQAQHLKFSETIQSLQESNLVLLTEKKQVNEKAAKQSEELTLLESELNRVSDTHAATLVECRAHSEEMVALTERITNLSELLEEANMSKQTAEKRRVQVEKKLVELEEKFIEVEAAAQTRQNELEEELETLTETLAFRQNELDELRLKTRSEQKQSLQNSEQQLSQQKQRATPLADSNANTSSEEQFPVSEFQTNLSLHCTQENQAAKEQQQENIDTAAVTVASAEVIAEFENRIHLLEEELNIVKEQLEHAMNEMNFNNEANSIKDEETAVILSQKTREIEELQEQLARSTDELQAMSEQLIDRKAIVKRYECEIEETKKRLYQANIDLSSRDEEVIRITQDLEQIKSTYQTEIQRNAEKFNNLNQEYQQRIEEFEKEKCNINQEYQQRIEEFEREKCNLNQEIQQRIKEFEREKCNLNQEYQQRVEEFEREQSNLNQEIQQRIQEFQREKRNLNEQLVLLEQRNLDEIEQIRTENNNSINETQRNQSETLQKMEQTHEKKLAELNAQLLAEIDLKNAALATLNASESEAQSHYLQIEVKWREVSEQLQAEKNTSSQYLEELQGLNEKITLTETRLIEREKELEESFKATLDYEVKKVNDTLQGMIIFLERELEHKDIILEEHQSLLAKREASLELACQSEKENSSALRTELTSEINQLREVIASKDAELAVKSERQMEQQNEQIEQLNLQHSMQVKEIQKESHQHIQHIQSKLDMQIQQYMQLEERQLVELQATSARHECELKKFEEQLTEQQVALVDLQERVNEKDQLVQSVSAELNKSKKAVESRDYEVKCLQERFANLEEERKVQEQLFNDKVRELNARFKESGLQFEREMQEREEELRKQYEFESKATASTINELQNKLAASTKTIVSFEEEIQCARQALESQKAMHAQVFAAHVDSLTAEKKALNVQVNAVEQQLVQREDELGKVQAKLKQVSSVVTKHEKELIQKKEIITTINEEYSKLIEQNEKLKSQISEHSSKTERTKASQIHAEKEIDRIHKIHATQMEEQENRHNEELNRIFEERRVMLESLEATKAAKDSEVEEVCGKYVEEIENFKLLTKNLQNQNEFLEHENVEKEELNEQLLAKLNEFKDELSKRDEFVYERVNEDHEKLSQLNRALDAKTKMIEESKANLLQAKKDMQEMKKLLDYKNKEIEQQKNELKDFYQKTQLFAQNRDAELKDVKEHHSKLLEEHNKIMSEFEALQKSADGLSFEKNQLIQDHRKAQMNEKKMKMQLVEAIEAGKNLKEDNNQFQREIEELNNQITALGGHSNPDQKIKMFNKMKEENTLLKNEKKDIATQLHAVSEQNRVLAQQIENMSSQSNNIKSNNAPKNLGNLPLNHISENTNNKTDAEHRENQQLKEILQNANSMLLGVKGSNKTQNGKQLSERDICFNIKALLQDLQEKEMRIRDFEKKNTIAQNMKDSLLNIGLKDKSRERQSSVGISANILNASSGIASLATSGSSAAGVVANHQTYSSYLVPPSMKLPPPPPLPASNGHASYLTGSERDQLTISSQNAHSDGYRLHSRLNSSDNHKSGSSINGATLAAAAATTSNTSGLPNSHVNPIIMGKLSSIQGIQTSSGQNRFHTSMSGHSHFGDKSSKPFSHI